MDDLLPISVSEHLVDDKFYDGANVSIKGQFRSYNKTVGERSKLMLTVFVRDVFDYDDTINPNTVETERLYLQTARIPHNAFQPRNMRFCL